MKNSENKIKTGKNGIVNIGDKFGLDEKAITELLENLQKALCDKIIQSGENVTDEVNQTLSALIERKVTEAVCSLTEGQHSSEREIILTVQQNFRALQNNFTNLAATIKAELDGLRENGNGVKSLGEGLNALQTQYEYQSALSSDILKILEPIKEAADREKRTAEIELNSAWEGLKEAQFDHAQELFRRVIDNRNYNVAEAYFGLALAESKVQLIWDYTQNRVQPICFDYGINFSENRNYKEALEFCSGDRRAEYISLAADIGELLSYFREFRAMEGSGGDKPDTAYDCFICVKVSDKDGNKTDDCKWIEDNRVYEALNKEVRTFYSEIDCGKYAEKGTLKYGALILYALSRAKCLLLVCSEEEYLQTPWVKNEYTRFCNFLKLRNQDAGKQIVMVIKGKEVELPNGLRSKGYQDIDRMSQTNILSLVETVQSKVNSGKGYVERYWKYCPKCGEQYSINKIICNSDKGCAGTRLVDTHIYLNELLRKERERLQCEREEFRKNIDELTRKEEEAKKREEALLNDKVKAEKDLKKAKEQLKKQTVAASADIANAETIPYDSGQFEIEGAVLLKYSGDENQAIIPDGIKVIVKGAFENCSWLESITIPDSVSVIKDGAFVGCSKLRKIYYTGDLESWCGKNWFKQLMREIAAHTLYFAGKRVPSELVIPEDVTEIPDYAFYGCRTLKSVIIPDGVKSIGVGVFGNCRNLTAVTIPASVIKIEYSAFEDCKSLKNIFYNGNIESWCTKPMLGNLMSGDRTLYIEGKELTGELVIPDGVESIIDRAFTNCRNLSAVTIPASVTSIGAGAFWYCDSLKDIYYNGSIESWCGITGLNNLTLKGRMLHIGGKELTGELVIPDGVQSIVAWAFLGCDNVIRVILPESLKNIGAAAFLGCEKLTSIVLPESLECIGANALGGCTSLKSIVIPKNIKNIESYSFSCCDSLVGIYYQGNIESWCEINGLDNLLLKGRILYIDGKELAGELVIPEGVNDIADGAFSGCDKLTSVVLPESLERIGNSAFSGCSSLNGINIPESVTSIGDHAFEGCGALTEIHIPSAIKTVGRYAFKDCSSLTIYGNGCRFGWYEWNPDGRPVFEAEFEIKDSVLKKYNGSRVEVIIPDGVTSVGDEAFYGCSSLTSVIIPDGVTYIGYVAFKNCDALTSIKIPDSVVRIREWAVSGCSSLTRIFIPDSVEIIGGYVFSGCEKLTIYCEAKKRQKGWHKYWNGGCRVIWKSNRSDVDND